MSWLEQIEGVLQRYKNSPGTNPPPNASTDFAQVAAHAPPDALSGGLAEAFRSGSTPPFEQMISSLFGSSGPQQRAGILNHLLAAAGPAASGILSRFGQGPTAPASQAMTGTPTVTPEQAQQIEPRAVRELAAEAQKNDPSIVERASQFYAQHPQLFQSLGEAALALIMSHVSRQH